MEGLEIYEKMAQPPRDALREIRGGRLAGMSDINPQWRYRIMTEVFGLCGIGWKYTVDRTWTEQGADGEVFCFVQVSLFIKQGDEWSDRIPGVGGNMLISKERNRSGEGSHLYNNDEAFKMSLTDALGTAMQRIGVAADVYAGKWDGSKYAQSEPQREPVKLGKGLEEIAKEKAMTALLQYSPEQRKEYYTKHGGLIIGKTPDGKDRWSGIDWVALAKELGAINA